MSNKFDAADFASGFTIFATLAIAVIVFFIKVLIEFGPIVLLGLFAPTIWLIAYFYHLRKTP